MPRLHLQFSLMKAILAKIRHFFSLLLSFIPRKVPNGRAEFDRFAGRIIDTFGFPDNDSFRNMIAGMIQHAPQTAHRLSPHYFGCRIRKAVSNEVAYYVMMDFKTKKEEIIKTEAEATAQPSNHEDAKVANQQPQKTIQLQGV